MTTYSEVHTDTPPSSTKSNSSSFQFNQQNLSVEIDTQRISNALQSLGITGKLSPVEESVAKPAGTPQSSYRQHTAEGLSPHSSSVPSRDNSVTPVSGARHTSNASNGNVCPSQSEDATIATDEKFEDIRIADSPSVPHTNVMDQLHFGDSVLLVPLKRGSPKFKYIQLSKDNASLQWYSHKQKPQDTRIEIKNIHKLLTGQLTPAFKRLNNPHLNCVSFSVIYYQSNGTHQRTLDVICKSIQQHQLWYSSISKLLDTYRCGVDLSLISFLEVKLRKEKSNSPTSRKPKLAHGQQPRRNASEHRKQVRNLQKTLVSVQKVYRDLHRQAKHPALAKSGEKENVTTVLNEMKGQIKKAESHLKSDVYVTKLVLWDIDTDLRALSEKVKVLIDAHKPRKSRFW